MRYQLLKISPEVKIVLKLRPFLPSSLNWTNGPNYDQSGSYALYFYDLTPYFTFFFYILVYKFICKYGELQGFFQARKLIVFPNG